MPQIVTFIGWHDCGKTTLAVQVVSHLKEMGYRVAVVKSSKEEGVAFDTPGSDSYRHRQAGADSVLFVAPDQMVLMTDNTNISLTTIAHRYLPDFDIVIGEGFKHAGHVAKIEVVRDPKQQLRKEVHGVIAVATDLNISSNYIFRLNESRKIALFIQKRFLDNGEKSRERTVLLINGDKVPLKEFVQKSLAGTVAGFVRSLKCAPDIREIELRITLNKKQ